MGRPAGSKNGQGIAAKQNIASSKSIFNGKRTASSSSSSGSSTQKVNNGVKSTEDGQNNNCCSSPTIDRSQTNFPFDIRINGFSSLLNTVRKANQRVRKLILDECDIILECRVCRNLFRSLPNFLAHKQTFCKNNFNHLADSGFSQFIQNSPTSYEFQYHLDQSLLESCVDVDEESVSQNPASSSANGSGDMPKQDGKMLRLHNILKRIAPEIENATRTPSALYSDIVMRKNRQSSRIQSQVSQSKPDSVSEKVHVLWEPLAHRVPPSNGVVLQRTIAYDPSNCDVSSVHADNRQIAENDTAVLGPDGKIICVGDAQVVEKIVNKVIAQVEELQDEQQRRETELKCPDCLTLFPTQKTLRMHVRAAHRNTPEHEEEQILQALAESKLMYERSIADPSLDDNSGDSSNGDRRCSSPAAKKLKSEEQDRRTEDDSSLASGFSRSQTPLPLVTPPKPSTAVFTSIAKRPRGRPRKNSFLKKDGPGVSDSTSGSPSRSDSGDRTKSSLLHDRKSPRHGKLSPRGGIIFTCLKCPQKFSTKSEMTLHLSRCTGKINIALLQRSESPDAKKAGIQIRRDYAKENETKNSETSRSPRKPYPAVNGYIHKHYSSAKLDWSRHSSPSKQNISSSTAQNYDKPPADGTVGSSEGKCSSAPKSRTGNRPGFGVSSDSAAVEIDGGMGDDEDEDDDQIDVHISENNCTSDSSGDDGLPFEDVKSVGHEVDVDTDRDSNITDSGVSTTSVTTKESLSKDSPGDEASARVSENDSNETVISEEVTQGV